MEKVKMKYLGQNPTRVLTERNGSKVEVESGEVVEMDKDVALSVAKAYKNIWVPEDFDVPALKKTDAQIEGGLDEDKVEKAVPKKKK